MYKLYPYFTNDGSVGLFSPDADDIYHSTHGALTEAYEKFILPLDLKKFFQLNNEIKILDICYGIGYNSKSFLNYYLENIYNETIGSDNILSNDKIYTDNIKRKIFIHAIDKDKILMDLSPFFKTNNKFIKNKKLLIDQGNIKKYLSSSRASSPFKINNEVNVILLNSIINLIDKDSESVLFDKKYRDFFNSSLIAYFKHLKNIERVFNPIRALNLFLHNIYYKYISSSHKKAYKCLKNIEFCFAPEIADARYALINDNSLYNFVFLDAFTPAKCPCLWTLDFLKLIYNHLEPGGIVLTYSNSAAVRNAFINSGFEIKKIYSESMKKYTGTVAIKNNSNNFFINDNLVHELSEYDLGLLKTKAGIFYRDKNLNASNEEILACHKNDVDNSNKISVTLYKKRVKFDKTYNI